MKILTAQQIREADAYTMEHEPIKSIDLMERAAKACAEWLQKQYEKKKVFHIFCGIRNNGGDGIAIARLLHEKEYKVKVYLVEFSEKSSEDFRTNEQRLKKLGIPLSNLNEEDYGSALRFDPATDVIVDAIFGSGLNSPVEKWIAMLMHKINASKCPVVSIDVPSGLFCEDNSKCDLNNVIQATYTLTFGAPKLSFLFAITCDFIGEIVVLDIGLDKKFLADVKTPNCLLTREEIKKILKPRKKNSHKGTYGHALLVTGSYGKMGAAVLASSACMRSGVGLLTTHVPKCGYNIMLTSVPEAMVNVDSSEFFISDHIHLEKYDAIGIGPGLGTEKQTQNILKLLIQNTQTPLVIDADAINIIAENKTWLSFLPANTIFTPHPKEFERLVGKANDDYDRFNMQKEFAMKHGVFIVLKGTHTSIACPNGEVYFNSTGNPGMATGGSGDVLTGIITGLLAQDYSPKDACLIGVYLHGLAGDFAAENLSQEAMIASDIIQYMGMAFTFVKTTRIDKRI